MNELPAQATAEVGQGASNELGLDDNQFRLMGIFCPYSLQKNLDAKRTNQRFVYYTTGDTAVQILRKREIWMRKSHLMNDYREIEHGSDCLSKAYRSHKPKMQSIFDDMFPGFCERLETAFNNWLPHFRVDTYITCISEHSDSEDQYGRLSMWRAYGTNARVALVVNGGPFVRPTHALKAYASPVGASRAASSEASSAFRRDDP